jgi:hypothetical protein
MTDEGRRTVRCTLAGYGKTTGEASVVTVRHGAAARLVRAVSGLAPVWLAGLLAIFIPIAHFLLVPGFGVLGLWVFWRRWTTRESVHSTSGTCPDCGHEQKFDLAGQWQPPHHVTCQHCQRSLVLAAADDQT